jgi:DNA/RNA endonuclease YhcR with UshA esterase domain
MRSNRPAPRRGLAPRPFHVLVLFTALAVVSLATGVAPAAATPQPAPDLELIFGLLHGHTSFSDGTGTPADAYQSARDAGLDFFAVTEHNHAQAGGSDGVFLTTPLYEELKRSAEDATEDGEFVALYGQEVSSISKGNHVNVFNSSTIVDVANGDFRDLYERYLVDHPEVPLVQLNHPDVSADRNPNTAANKRNNDYGIDDYDQSFPALLEASGRWVALIEMIIGPAFGNSTAKPHHGGTHQDDYLFYLNEGFRLGPSVGQDNHNANWGSSTHARLGAWATELTHDGVYEALTARRTYASEDENVSVKLKLGDTWMGGTAALPMGEEAVLELGVADPDEPDARYTAVLFYDQGIGGEEATEVDATAFTGDADQTFRHTPVPGGYYFVKLTQRSSAESSADDVWTAPIWITELDPDADDPGEEHSPEGEISWEQAMDFVGQEKTVRGRIVDTFNSGRVLFLNFDFDFRDTLTLVVFDDHFDDFGGADALELRVAGREVVVKGVISLFRGRPQLILREAGQILEVEDE